MLNHEYELMLIFRPDLDDSDITARVEKVEGMITDNGGTLLLRDDWGKRKLAYAIKNHLKGHYFLLQFASPSSTISEVERRLRNEEPIVRFMTVKVGDDVDVAERMEAAKVVQKQRAEEAAARAAAEAEAAAAEAAAQAKAAEYMEANKGDKNAASEEAGPSAEA